MMCSRPRARRKYFLPKSTLDSWACTRNSQPLATGRDESFPHVVGRLFRTCGVGVRPCTRNRTKCAAGVLAGHSAIAFRRRESRRGSTIVQGVVVMAKGYSMCVRAMPGQYIGSPWRGVPGGNHHSIPGYTCMRRSRAPIRAALRFVEIANKAICDRNSPAVLREHTQFGPRGSS